MPAGRPVLATTSGARYAWPLQLVLQPRPAALQHSDVIRELIRELATPLRGLLVALAGVLLAYLWYDHHRVWAIIIGVVACLAGLIADGIGKSLLPNRPAI